MLMSTAYQISLFSVSVEAFFARVCVRACYFKCGNPGDWLSDGAILDMSVQFR